MPSTAPSLQEMTVPEKLRLMEALWEDLSSRAEDFPSPDWHRKILDDRESRIATGEAQFTAWEQAKADLRQRLL